MTTDSQSGRAGRREWIGLICLLLPLLLVSMDVSILYFAVPFITKDLRLTGTEQLWVLDIYGFVLAGLLVTMGTVGDRIGRRKLLMMGAAAFGGASLLAAYAKNPQTLIAARALLGVGGATLMPSTLALIRNMFRDEKQRNVAIAVWTAGLSAGVALGPVISGLLLDRFWWGSVFLVNVPVMVLLLILAPVMLPEFKNPDPVRFDVLSALLSLISMLSAIYGITELAANGVHIEPVLYVVGGVIVGALFVRRQIVRPGSLIDIGLFRRSAFSGSAVVNLLCMAAIVGFAVFLTQYLQLVLGMRPLQAALWSLVPSLATSGIAPAAAAMARKINRAFIMAGGFLLAAAGFVVLSQVHIGTALWVVLLGATCYAGGIVAVISLVTGLALGVAPPERAGSASALLESGTELGGALGIAILGSIGTAVYRAHIAQDLPAGLPAAVLQPARQSLAGAAGAAANVPGLGTSLLASARVAFMDGFGVVALTASGVMAAGALLAIVVLRKAGAVPPLPPSPQPAPMVNVQAHVRQDIVAVAREQVLGRGERLTEAQILEVLQVPDDRLAELLGLAHDVRLQWCGPEVEVEGIVSLKTGGCPEDCHFCSQSGQFSSPVRSALLSIPELVQAARRTRATGATDFCIVAAVRGPDARLMSQVREGVKAIHEAVGIQIAASLGILSREQAGELAAMGVHRYNHNLETARSYFPRVVTTHSWQERWDTCQLVREAGMELCCGALVGMGESVAQRAELAAQLGELGPHEVPLNFLNPRPGTPFGDLPVMKATDALRTIAAFRLALPRTILRYAGGRELTLGDLGTRDGLLGGINAVIVGNYLTTLGRDPGQDLALLADLQMPVKALNATL